MKKDMDTINWYFNTQKRLNGNKNHRKANSALIIGVSLGHIIRQDTCEWCGENTKKIVAHHYDYSKPLDVMWLCNNCHYKIHRLIADDEKKKRFVAMFGYDDAERIMVKCGLPIDNC